MLIPVTKLKAALSLLATWLCFWAAAQNTIPFETFTTSQGLSQGMVNSMLQDADGFIWIGTKEGLNRYDGYQFKVFTNDPYDPYSLGSNNIQALSEDSKGHMWASTENAGISVYDKISGQFRRIVHNASNSTGLISNTIRQKVCELADGRFIALPEGGTNFANIITLPGDFFTSTRPAIITSLALPSTSGYSAIASNNKGQVYIGFQDNTLYLYRPDANAFEKLPKEIDFNGGTPNADGTLWNWGITAIINDNKVYPVFKTDYSGCTVTDKLGRLWQSNWNDLTCHDISSWHPGAPIEREPAIRYVFKQFPSKLIMLDRGGNLWQGGRGQGLRKYLVGAYRFRHLAVGQSVRKIQRMGGDTLLLSSWVGMSSFTQQGKALPQPGFVAAFKDFYLTHYLIARNGDIWGIANDRSRVLQYHKASHQVSPYALPASFKLPRELQPVWEDRNGYLWFCNEGGELLRVNPATGQPSYYYIKDAAGNKLEAATSSTILYEDAGGVIWVGTTLGFAGINFAGNPNSQPNIKWYNNNASNHNSLNYNHVSSFVDDPADNNYLWIGTKGGGINRLNKKTGDFTHLTTANGLPHAVVNGLLPDSAGNIWGSTNKGLFCLLAKKSKTDTVWQFRNFTKTDGLQEDEFNGGAATALPNGELAFGGINGVSIFKPAEILDKAFEPNVFITNILVGNQPILPNDATGILQQTIEHATSITLTHLQDLLTLEFSSLDFTAPGQNKYHYQMEGLDKDWVESGTRRTATYLHLPAGKYTFKVQGSNSQGIWSEKIARLSITVLPPWWRSWWAYGVYALLLAIAIRAYFNFTVNRAKLRNQLNFEQLEAKRIKELDTVKTQLYTNITHEFRTPLTVILGMAKQVKDNPAANLDKGVDMIVRNGESLLRLVNEMLDLSKLETGKMQLRLVQGDVVNFLRYIVESFHSLAESQQKHLHLLAELDELHVEYDPEKVRQILSNLLSNALKFTPEKGNIYIGVNMAASENAENSCHLIIKVKDTGIGIPEAQIEHIFDRFYQLDNSHSRSAEGTGIGLALTKELVKLMDGEITVKSPPTGANKGSEFMVVLPFKRTAAAETMPVLPPLPQMQEAVIPVLTKPVQPEIVVPKNGAKKSLILLVEDNADVVAYTASCLPDYRLAVGKDGVEGFEIAAELIPDLIITDVMMPFVDGFELCRQLREDEHTSHIPIIMLTAKADLDSKLEGLNHGADVYLEKPFNREELLVRIKKLLELRKNLQEYYLKKAGLPSVLPQQEAIANAEIVLPKNATEDVFVKKVREAVEANLSDAAFSVEQLCKLLFMSHSQLHRKLDALTGCPPNKFIRIIRLNKARELMATSTDSIASIAMDCGYNDAGYFARVFKQEYGVTPQEWRVNHA